MNSKKRFQFFLFYSTAFLQGICIVLIPAASFIFKSKDTHFLTDQQYGILFLPMVLSSIFITFGFNSIAKKIGRLSTFYLGYFFHLVYLTLILLASFKTESQIATFTYLSSANFFLGIGFGFLLTSINTFCIDLYPKKRSLVLSGLHGFFGLGAAAGPLLVHYFYDHSNWNKSLITVFLLILITALLSTLVHKENSALKISFKKDDIITKLHLIPKGVLFFIFLLVLYGITESIIANWSVIYLVQNRGVEAHLASKCLSIFWGFLTIGRLGVVGLLLFCGAKVWLRLSPVVILIGILTLNFLKVDSFIWFPYIIMGLGCSYFFPLVLSLATQYYPLKSNQFSGYLTAGLMIGVGIGSSVIGFLKQIQFIEISQAFFIAFGCAVILILLTFVSTQKPIPEQSKC